MIGAERRMRCGRLMASGLLDRALDIVTTAVRDRSRSRRGMRASAPAHSDSTHSPTRRHRRFPGWRRSRLVASRRRFLAGLARPSRRCVDAAPRARRRSAQDRPDPAADRPVCVDRQADRGRVPSLHGAQRRHRRRTQGRADRQGRHRARARDDQANRAGAGRAGARQRARRLRADAARARRRAGRNRGQGADGRDGRGDVDHSDALAVHRAHADSRCRRSRRRSPTGPRRTTSSAS